MVSKNWGWIGKYVIVMFAVFILGMILSNLALFQSTSLGSPKFTASLLMEFITRATALALLWMLGWQTAQQMRARGERPGMVAAIVMALATLLITALGYVVISGFIDPFTSKGVKQAVNWIFILGVVGTAGWFILALFAGADELIATVRNGLTGKRQA